MKVAMLGSFPPLRGISSYCFELAHAIADNYCEVNFISFKSMYPKFLYPGSNLQDDNTFPVIFKRTLRVERKIVWYNPVNWIVEGVKNRFSLLHVQWWSLPLAPIYLCLCLIYKFRGKPVVFTVHNVLSHDRSTMYFLISKILFRFGDHFIIHSKVNFQQLATLFQIEPLKISLIPHGPLDLQVNPRANSKKIRTDLGFISTNKIILFFGAIRPYKGVDTAIEALAKVKAEIPEVKLLIAGKLWEDWKPYDALIKKHGIEKDVITCLRYIPSVDVHRFFCASDLVILPYHHFDSQSGVGGTALSFRKPLVVTRVGGLPDLVLDSQAIVPPANSRALADAITSALNNPDRLRKMAQDADSVAKRFSWESIAKRTIVIYESLIKRSVYKS